MQRANDTERNMARAFVFLNTVDLTKKHAIHYSILAIDIIRPA